MISVIFGVALAFVGTVNCAERSLPPFIESCSRSDSNLNQCFIEKANKALPFLKDDNKKYKINGFDPLKVSEATLRPGNNLRLTIKNMELYGLTGGKLTNADINLDERKVKLHISLPHIQILGDYEIDGRIVILPIQGHGKANISSSGIEIDTTITIERKESNGINQLTMKFDKLDFTVIGVHYYFGNLFNDEESVLAKEMQKFLDENWKEVHQEFYPELIQLLKQVLDISLQQILKDVPADTVILP